MIILSILAVPLLLIIMILSIVRLRQRGNIYFLVGFKNLLTNDFPRFKGCCSERKRAAKLDLGSLLGHRDPIRGGFEKLAMEDSDGDGEMDSDSDADVVEFTKAKRDGQFKA